MILKIKYFILPIVLCFSQLASAQLDVNTSSNASELMDILLNENSNITYANASITGAEGSSGIYESAEFGVGEGVILTTGVVDDAPGPNIMTATSSINNTPGDPDLDEISGSTTFDAVYLEADLTTSGSTIEFSFVFASEDYFEYVCSPFYDVMGFFVDGGEYENENFALIPETDLLINSNTVNDGNPGTAGSSNPDFCPEGGLDNEELFVNNVGGFNHEYDGRTIVLSVSIPVTPGETYAFKWSIADGFDQLFDSAVFLEAGSLFSEPVDCTAEGGELSIDGPTMVCKSDGEDDIINLILEGAEGENQIFVVTWEDGEIFLISEESEFNLEGIPGNGSCLFWNLSWDGDISGLEVGLNAFDITGDCFDFSNPVEVIEYFTDGGIITTQDPTTICVGDGIPDPIDVTLEGAVGQNSAWVITDADLNILELPQAPPFDLEGAEPGTCLIWHLSWSGELNGAAVGENAGDLMGDCFDLSDPIEVIREDCSGCTAEGGELSIDGPTMVCKSDGEDDIINLILEGAEGENQIFVITFANGDIFAITEESEFNLEGIPGNGICLFWNLSWDGEISGLEVGLNAFDIAGDCFDFSNPVEVIEYFTDGGIITTQDPTTICVGDGIPDPIDVTLEGAVGQNSAWVITDADLNILELPQAPPFDLEGAEPGTCLIWHLSWSGELNGAAVGENAGDLMGDCFDLSDPIEVIREDCSGCTAEGGELSIDGPTMVCKSDGEDDIINLILEGAEGENQIFVVTFANGDIFAITEDSEFNLEGIPGNGSCLFWNLSWDGEISGLEVGLNAFDIAGDCLDFSNPVEVIEYFTDGGIITTQDPTTFCAGDTNPIDVNLEGGIGENSAWVITDTELTILELPGGPPFDFSEAEPGTCLIWHLSWSGDLFGANVGENAGDLMGDCFDLSNSIEIERLECGNPNFSDPATSILTVFPNPTEGNTQVFFEIPETTRITVEIYDMTGRLIETLFNQVADGEQTYRLDFNGSDLPDGVYVCRISNGEQVEMTKFMIGR